MLRRTNWTVLSLSSALYSMLSGGWRLHLQSEQHRQRFRVLRVDSPGKSQGEAAMAFEALQSELGLLITRMQNEPEDRHELYLVIRQKLNEMKAYGMPLPDDRTRQVRRACLKAGVRNAAQS
jgi:hypothetical protein